MEHFTGEKLQHYFEDAIEEASSKKIKALAKEIADFKKKEMVKIEAEVRHQVDLSLGVKLKDIQDRLRHDANQLTVDNGQKLFQHRQKIAEGVFSAVFEKLNAFVAGPHYSAWLETKLSALAAVFPDEPVVLAFSEADASGKAIAKRFFPTSGQIVSDSRIRIGGFQAVGTSSRQEVDESFDSKLENHKEWFYAHSKLFIKK